MHCPFCKVVDTKVVDSRLLEDGSGVRRRRACTACMSRFTTLETAQVALPRVVKRDGRRSTFKEAKLRAGMLKALEKRPVSTADVDAAVREIVMQLSALGEHEVTSQLLGDKVMLALRALDHVAYVRFASVYRAFEDVEAFKQAVREVEDASLV